MSIVNGGVPFFGVREMSVHCDPVLVGNKVGQGPNSSPDRPIRIEK